MARELIWLEITVILQQVIFRLGWFPDPDLWGPVLAMQEELCQRGTPQGSRHCLTWAAARYLSATCGHANHTSEDVAATVHTAPGKR